MTYVEIPQYGSAFIIKWIEENMHDYKWETSFSAFDGYEIRKGVHFNNPEDATLIKLKFGL